MSRRAKEIRIKILSDFYENHYQDYIFGKSPLSWGIKLFEEALENTLFGRREVDRLLEIGGGSGEHLRFVRHFPRKEYVSLDVRPPLTSQHLHELDEYEQSKFRFVVGNAEELPFCDGYFDRSISTCVLHHVEDPLSVMMELRRVTRSGGEIAVMLPTDPGVVNRIIKRIVSFRRMKKLANVNPNLILALDHRNHIHALIEIAKFVFQEDNLKIDYLPLRIPSWNLNLMVRISAIKS